MPPLPHASYAPGTGSSGTTINRWIHSQSANYLANSCSAQHHHIIPIVIVSAAVTVLGSVLEVATMVME